jgi:hypothetical protein
VKPQLRDLGSSFLHETKFIVPEPPAAPPSHLEMRDHRPLGEEGSDADQTSGDIIGSEFPRLNPPRACGYLDEVNAPRFAGELDKSLHPDNPFGQGSQAFF